MVSATGPAVGAGGDAESGGALTGETCAASGGATAPNAEGGRGAAATAAAETQAQAQAETGAQAEATAASAVPTRAARDAITAGATGPGGSAQCPGGTRGASRICRGHPGVVHP